MDYPLSEMSDLVVQMREEISADLDEIETGLRRTYPGITGQMIEAALNGAIDHFGGRAGTYIADADALDELKASREHVA
jgi:hypothetical protein